MTGDCHVRFCERLAGETPACLLGDLKNAPRTTKKYKRKKSENKLLRAITSHYEDPNPNPQLLQTLLPLRQTIRFLISPHIQQFQRADLKIATQADI